MEELGSPIPAQDLVRLPWSRPVEIEPGRWQGEVIHVDHFGNLVTNIRAAELPGDAASWTFEIGDWQASGLRATYSDVPPGSLLALTGSSGRVEIAICDGNAVESLGFTRGAPICAQHHISRP